MEQAPLTRAWIKAAMIALGVLLVAIPIIRFAPLRAIVDRSAAFLFAALLPPIIGFGLYSLLRLHRNTVTLAVALVSLLMFTFAHVLHTIIERMIGSVPAEAEAILAGADQAPVNAALAALIVVLHMAKGILAPIYIFFFALNMIGHPRFGVLIGAAGMLIAVVRFAKNVFYFPEHGPLWPALMGADWLWTRCALPDGDVPAMAGPSVSPARARLHLSVRFPPQAVIALIPKKFKVSPTSNEAVHSSCHQFRSDVRLCDQRGR